jgi:hypothetical protein
MQDEEIVYSSRPQSLYAGNADKKLVPARWQQYTHQQKKTWQQQSTDSITIHFLSSITDDIITSSSTSGCPALQILDYSFLLLCTMVVTAG